MVLKSMDQKCGTNHPILQLRFKHMFKSWLMKVATGVMLASPGVPASIAAAEFVGATDNHQRLATHLVSSKLSERRDKFEDAERKVRRANEHEFFALQATFIDYPLWPYLEAEYWRNNLSVDNEVYIRSFLQRYYGSPPERSLRDAWLSYLAQRNDGERFTRDFVDRGSAQLKCRYLGFRLDMSPSEQVLADEIWPKVQARWTQPESQPRVCDKIFAQWVDAGKRSQDIVWERFEMAVAAGVWNIARYTRSLLADDDTELANHIMSLRQRPQTVTRYQRLPYQNERMQRHLIAAMRQLAWSNLSRARRLWPDMREEVAFSDMQRQLIDTQIGIALAVRNETEARAWFESIDTAALNSSGQHWFLTTLLREHDFEAVLAFTEKMDDGAQRMYWQARALTELERPVEAEALWQALAQQRHYYGFMAAAHLDQPPNTERTSVIADPDATLSLLGRPEVQRAYEFFQLNRHFDARREWNLVRARVGVDERKAAAVLAHQWGWFDQSIRELAELGLMQDLERRFPLGYESTLRDHASSRELDLAWVLAIVRRESAFQVDAVSPVGARGLMQLMPGTAQHLQRSASAGRPPQRTPNLNNPAENIGYGTRYLQGLLRRHDGNWLLATASYNAGYQRVRQWVPSQPLAVDIWIETIPFQETRDYVKAVLTYQQIYLSLLGQDDKLLQHMHSMLMDPQGGLCDYADHQPQPIALC